MSTDDHIHDVTGTAATEAPGGVLRHSPFGRLLAALAASQAGDWLYNVALLGLVYERTGSSAWVALTTAARVVPIVAFGPLGGIVADRFDRRRVMIASDLVRAAMMVALAIVAAAGLPIVLAPLLAAAATGAASPYPPSVAATTARLVADDDLPRANALRSAVAQACIVVGPALGALLLLVAAPPVAFALNAGTFAVSALLVASIPAGAVFRPAGARVARPGLLAELRDGAAALRESRPVMVLVGADVMCSAVYGAQTVLLVVLSRDLGHGGNGYGYLLAAIGAGGLLGAAIAGRAADSRSSSGLLVAALLAVAAAMALLAAAPTLLGALVLAAAGGAGAIIVEVLTETGLQRSLDEAVFTRAYGIALPASLAGIVAGSLAAAPLAAVLGVAGAFVACGGAVALYAACLLRPALTGRPVGQAAPTAA